jgi:YbbR domain-containing protein
VPISKKKTVAIKATFLNAPSGIGKDITYTLSETEVSVIGSPDIIDSLTEIELAPLDFREISYSTTTFEAQFDLPDGIRLIDSIEFVTVKFNFNNFSQYTFTIDKIEPINLGSGLTATVTGAVKNVKICGPYAQLRNLKASDFTAQIELLGKTAGEYTVPVKVYCQTSSSVWQYGEYTAVVVIK